MSTKRVTKQILNYKYKEVVLVIKRNIFYVRSEDTPSNKEDYHTETGTGNYCHSRS